ncbi:MAG TPA: DUF58 domain-containing protein [Actinomycetota bacterium]|nr:DUF58 domain-containing protein [Actinomycetota bacterium]
MVGLFAIAWGEAVVLLWAAAIGGLAIAATLWARSALGGIEVEAAFEPPRAFVGEDVVLRVRIANTKRTPLPIVRLLVRYPPDLLPESDGDPTALRGHRRRLSLAGRSEVELRLSVVAPTRGEFWLEGLDVTVSDPFDLAPVRLEAVPERPLLVMPQPRTGLPLQIARRLPFGAPAPAVRLFEDREHFAGVRDYEPGDPMHHVHWRASAHVGRLQTKRFEPTRSAEVLFAVDVSHGEPFWHAVDPETAEETIAWASYLARQAIHAGWRTGLVANTHLRRGRGPLRVPASITAGNESILFAALARMPSQPTSDLGPVLREVGRRLVRRTTVIVISPRPGPALLHEMEVLRFRGCDVVHLSPLRPLTEVAS